jgi:hypothetical protein
VYALKSQKLEARARSLLLACKSYTEFCGQKAELADFDLCCCGSGATKYFAVLAGAPPLTFTKGWCPAEGQIKDGHLRGAGAHAVRRDRRAP